MPEAPHASFRRTRQASVALAYSSACRHLHTLAKKDVKLLWLGDFLVHAVHGWGECDPGFIRYPGVVLNIWRHSLERPLVYISCGPCSRGARVLQLDYYERQSLMLLN